MILDELEWTAVHATLAVAGRERAVDDFIALIAAVDGILQAQSKSDGSYFVRNCGRTLSAAEPAKSSIKIVSRGSSVTVPVWMLLGFAAWTALLLVSTVGIYRWSRIFSGRVAIGSFPADAVGGEEWYRRATRAHANCIENLPVFGAIVLGLFVGNVAGALVDALAITVLVARMCQSLVHVCFVHTNAVAAARFAGFFVQLVCFLWLVGIIVVRLAGAQAIS